MMKLEEVGFSMNKIVMAAHGIRMPLVVHWRRWTNKYSLHTAHWRRWACVPSSVAPT